MQARGSRCSALLPLLVLLSVGCGADFDRVSELNSVRVLGVQKDSPFPVPGQNVNVRLLWEDARLEAFRPPSPDPDAPRVTWLPACFNPPGNSYLGCVEQLSNPTGPIELKEGNQVDFQIDPALLSDLPASNGQPVFGSTYLFFALCAGQLEPDLSSPQGALPLVCRRSDGTLQGPDAFVVGYTTLYSYPEGFINENPTAATRFEIEGKSVQAACSDPADVGVASCVPATGFFARPRTTVEDCDPASDERCFVTCEEDGDVAECPGIDVRPLLNPAEDAELDAVGAKYFGRNVKEQMWVSYHVNGGGVRSDIRLLNDGDTGPAEDYGTEFYAPKDPGLVTLWAVARDNRGGASWSSVELRIVAPR